ncbi:MAG: hypothetical protein A3G33_04745 [Omnitrophica bacterium RIFCSPLOWO2_12_FULL_44_17]|uniref:Uncharacterized protein n=1 Tax=Candidatus Danuiimicrobium aquiferis TaxID=1801832 RepID=A0A1G1KQX2_9BACT|nr:MAG: hypothetical protein A3B72_10955 [Omnitrophica bacterium RIFCSPHIGHO2_02_FULL_45_28]OGW89394.1 MAG: hypothetical protein A3E74_02580 [Omnitrophica bacterium RIFCSPHIGHO2_12_FULL_44_12]OGW95242.1 MAG: hypothetical protein A3G33_04745 [Omnitrophica bacterium RIFCSPLOWO2_12_FULL_44_17]OGX02338.1 MAG: hypothetical protein A3J12_10070 [Omnitrophica bacterium RIFCSPLOWO2_02_FULL_44_11]
MLLSFIIGNIQKISMTKSPAKKHGGQAMTKKVSSCQITIGNYSVWDLFGHCVIDYWGFDACLPTT